MDFRIIDGLVFDNDGNQKCLPGQALLKRTGLISPLIPYPETFKTIVESIRAMVGNGEVTAQYADGDSATVIVRGDNGTMPLNTGLLAVKWAMQSKRDMLTEVRDMLAPIAAL